MASSSVNLVGRLAQNSTYATRRWESPALESASEAGGISRLETRKAEIDAELATPQVKPYSLHPNAAALYRQHIEELADQLEHPETGDQVRQSIRGLLETVTLTPAPDRGKKEFDLEVEGALGALLRAAGVEQKDAASIDAASGSESSGQLVAGEGRR